MSALNPKSPGLLEAVPSEGNRLHGVGREWLLLAVEGLWGRLLSRRLGGEFLQRRGKGGVRVGKGVRLSRWLLRSNCRHSMQTSRRRGRHASHERIHRCDDVLLGMKMPITMAPALQPPTLSPWCACTCPCGLEE